MRQNPAFWLEIITKLYIVLSHMSHIVTTKASRYIIFSTCSTHPRPFCGSALSEDKITLLVVLPP